MGNWVSLINKTVNKIQNRAGETIAETLIAILIAALALTMLAGAISSSGNIVKESRDKLNTYYSVNEDTVVKMSGTGTTVNNVSLAASGGTNVSNQPVGNITYYTNSTFKKAPVTAYKIKTSGAE